MIDDFIVNIQACGWRIKFLKCNKFQLAEFYMTLTLYNKMFRYSFTDVIEFVKLEQFKYGGVKVKLIE